MECDVPIFEGGQNLSLKVNRFLRKFIPTRVIHTNTSVIYNSFIYR